MTYSNSPISETQTPPSIVVGVIVMALASLCAGAFYGYLGSWVPLIVFKVLMVIIAVAIVGALVGTFKRGFVTALILAAIGGVGSVAGLWFGWLWLEFGVSDAWVLFRAGPEFLYQYLIDLSADYTYSTSRRGTSTDGGAGLTKFIWWGQSIVLAVSPFVFALFGRQVSAWADTQHTTS